MKKSLLRSLLFQILISFLDYLKPQKKPVFGRRLLFSLFIMFFYSYLWAQPPHTYTSDNTLFVPAGVTSMDVEGWGAGGSGGEASGAILDGRSGGGGGGGAYAKGKITVVPGATLNIRVAGIPAIGASGGNSTILGYEGIFLAAGGKAGTANNSGGTPAGGKGGLAADSFGSITKTSGVNGGDGSTGIIGLLQGSGAGGKGGDTGGGAGGVGITSIVLGNAAGKPGSAPGGGGSGAMNSLLGGLQTVGAGGSGQVNVNYTCPTYGITGVSASPVCSSSANTTITLTSSPTSLPVGVYTVAYNLTNPVSNGLTASLNVTTAGSGNFILSGFSTAGTRNITITRLTSGACFNDISLNNTASIVVSSPSVGGTVGGGTTICSGLASDVLTLTGNTGTVLNWESSVSPFSVWTPIVNTASTYTSDALTQTTQFRAVVQNGACSSTSSIATTVTVNPIPAPSFSVQPGASVCINTDVTYTTLAGQTNYIWSVPGIAGTDYNIISGGISSASNNVTLQWVTTGNKTVTVRYSSNGCPAVANATNTTSVIKTERGTVNGGLHICQGNPSPLLTFNNYVGTIVRWEYATTTPYVWKPISYTGVTYQPGILTESTSYRAVVKNGTCPEEFAIETRIDVDPVPSAPNILSFTQPNCTTPTGSITLSGLSGSGNILQSDGTVITPRVYSGTSLTISGLPLGKYKFAVDNNCTIIYSAEITIQLNTWNGSSWSYGTADPSFDDLVDFQEDYNLNKNINACSCTISNDAAVVIQHGKTLNVVKGVHVNYGTLTFADGGSLLQTSSDNNLNTGNVIYKRNSLPIRQADYVYWSSPVKGQKLISVSSLTAADKYFSNDGTKWIMEDRNKVMTVGKGYIIRGPETFSNTVRWPFATTFEGVPNNGDIIGETVVAEKYYLIGNPYPSALHADDFINGNLPVLEGTLYFGTHNTPVVLGGAYQYATDDYATYNLSGGIGTSTSAPSGSTSGNNNNPPSGDIAAGQSFFAETTASGTIVFNNSMRRGGDANTQFFKSDPTAKVLEKNRIWLNMTNTGGAFKQLLVGYIEGATNEYDRKYDGSSFDGNKYLDFYSINNEHKLAIQGRAIPFKNTDAVPLGYRTTIAGDFTISIYHVDGNLTLQSIYLEDKATNKIHDLRSGNYTFNTEAGTFPDRFVLRYTNKFLGIDDITNVEKNVWVIVNLKDMKVISNREAIQEVAVFDLSGRLIYEKKNINATELQILNFRSASQVLLVKVTLENGSTTTKKIAF